MTNLPMHNKLEPLFSPFKLKHLMLRNRFVMPAMQRGFTENCVPTTLMADYLRQRGEGGAALILSESVAPDHPSGYWGPQFCQLTRASMGAWAQIIGGVKATGAHFLLQLWHPGAIRKVDPASPYAAHPTLSPSGLIQEGRPNGRAMTLQDLDELKSAYVAAALLAQELGADGVELHCCHGYLLDQFLWSETNIRDDEYGGATLVERARYPSEILAAMRAAVGKDFLLSMRISQFKEVDYGAKIAQTPEELRAFVENVRAAGADCINVSSRRFYKPEWPQSDHPEWGIAAWVKSFGNGAVISCGSVGLDSDMFEDLFENQDPVHLRVERDLANASERLSRQEFDLIGVGRAHIANWDFVRKVQNGHFDQIAIFKKSLHLTLDFEIEQSGVVGEFRKVVADI